MGVYKVTLPFSVCIYTDIVIMYFRFYSSCKFLCGYATASDSDALTINKETTYLLTYLLVSCESKRM